MSDALSRRGFLGGVAAIGAGALLTPRPAAVHAAFQPKTAAPGGAQPFRFVHLTDIHVEPEREAAQGLAKALAAVEALRPRPDFILTGGDLVFDVLGASAERAPMLFDLYKKVMADHTSLPIHNTVGNHDVFGWARKHGVTPHTVGYGKELVKDKLGLKQTYYHFDHKGWRFFVLDNIQPAGGFSHGYQGFLDKPQLEWLAAELKATDPRTPVVFCEHIPSVTVTPFAYEENCKDGIWKLENSLVCADAATRVRLIDGHNVRLWLSGHIHALDRAEFRGTTFICDGAVCGNWWKGPRDGMNEGFGVIDLLADGTVRHRYTDYGWQAKPEPPRVQSQPAAKKEPAAATP